MKIAHSMIGGVVLLLATSPTLGEMATARAGAAEWSVVLWPDSQGIPGNSPIAAGMARWIISARDGAARGRSLRGVPPSPIAAVVHVGDIVDSAVTQPDRWHNMSAALDLLRTAAPPIPYSYLPGNHDLWQGNAPCKQGAVDACDASHYLERFAPAARMTWPGSGFRRASPALARGSCAATNDCEGLASEYIVDNGHGRAVRLLALPWGVETPRAGRTLRAWARQVIDEAPGVPTILSTHSGLYASDGKCRAYGRLWPELVRLRSDIFLTLSGHIYDPPSCYRQDRAADGRLVHRHFGNYQAHGTCAPECDGGGILQVVTIDEARGQIRVRTHSTVTGERIARDDYDAPFPWRSRFPEPGPGQP